MLAVLCPKVGLPLLCCVQNVDYRYCVVSKTWIAASVGSVVSKLRLPLLCCVQNLDSAFCLLPLREREWQIIACLCSELVVKETGNV